MRFYNMSERYNMNVSSPSIYTGPGTDYSKIDVYSDFFWVYGENSDWYYVQWAEGSGRLSHSCFGYMSKNSSSSSSQITPVEKYGTIYSPNGSKVDGLTRSYLIDGGAATYERHDLTHGWHIKAVNKYYNGINDWYELYDADDGDYYGWVNEEAISFY